MVKLTEEQVRVIKGLKGKVGQRLLAKRFGVCASTIHLIHTGKTWSHIDVPMGSAASAPSGEMNGQAKLTQAKADQIRALKGTASYRKIGKMFGVSENTVYRVMAGKRWTSE